MASSLDIQKSKNDLIKNNALDTEAIYHLHLP